MGVPKFFRYTSERYPCLNELVKQYQIPDFDNMYLDMNGIIHNCSHPDDSNPHFRITEEKIFQDIFHYIGILFQIIKPRKLFFMAIDGVAPRAKMNQQRGRRFRSAREAERLEEDAKAKGEVLPEEKRFDSNCITPGTVFMARLHEQLRYFVKQKMSTDPLWSKVKVVLSGHETPGEGEHKIMDYIRWARSQPDYDPNTRHCLYGLDADLIMLGMCTHEPHFALLREEVKFGKTTQRATSPEQTNFYLLHLSLLREYLDQEFISIKDSLPFDYDIEKIVDDWVLMGFLVGNDFIPHLPNMHIGNDALPLLYKTYMAVLPTLDGYINEAGDLNLGRFEAFMQELAKIDKEKFQDTYTDLKYFEAKTGRRPNANERKQYKPNNDDTFNVNIEDIKANEPDDELQALIDATQDMLMDDIDDGEEYEETSDEEANFEMEFVLHKMDYYMNKLDYSKVTPEVLANQAEGYVRAIQWNLFYYYKGCPSWCWYYPHHYAPYISDIKGFKDLKITFDIGEPFKPFEQLLAVLPSASKHLLPAPFHDLMTDEDSPIVHYYPINFETDLNGKKNDWEAVVLIPFIDEVNLLSAMEPCYKRLTEEEIKRNTHGPMLVYNWTTNDLGPVQAPEYFPAIASCHALEKEVWRHEIHVPDAELRRGLLPNADRHLLFPGFPTMRHLKYRTSIKKCKVKVFDQPSRNESMIVELLPEIDTNPNLDTLAQELLGKVIWVGWPHLTRAKVVSISNEKMRLHHVDHQNNSTDNSMVEKLPHYSVEHNTGNLHKQWISERSTIIEHNMNRLGIELGDVNVIVHAVNLKGYRYVVADATRMAVEEAWCGVACGHALQAAVRAAAAPPPPARYRHVRAAYPPADQVFLRTLGPYYGCLATVIDTEGVRGCRIKVSVKECVEPTPTAQPMASSYKSANHAAASCGISAQMLSRITGTILVIMGERNDLPVETQNKINLGLNLKFNKKNQEVSGYSRRCPVSGAWQYSARCVGLVRSYAQAFPDLFDRLAHCQGRDVFFEGDLWPGQCGENKPQEVQQWLKAQPHVKAARRQCGSEALEPEDLVALWGSLRAQLLLLAPRGKTVTLQVKWNLLYKPELHEGNISPDPTADFKLYDRVVCVSRNMTVPLGAKGTITAIYQPSDSNTVRLSDKFNAEPTYQVMFDEPFPGAQGMELFEEGRFYQMMPSNMLNISFGRRLRGDVAAPDEPFALGAPRNALRREDGHHSAFANYSPPREIKTPVSDNRVPTNNNAVKNDTEVQDSATHFLRSLLKISEDENSKSKSAQPADMNWRSKNNVSTATKTQRGDWRQENSAAANNNKPKQHPQQQNQTLLEWTNSSFKPTQPTEMNCRSKNNVSTATKTQRGDWRQESNAAVNNNKPKQHSQQQNQNLLEWTNSSFKSEPPIPPYPTFGPAGGSGQQFPNSLPSVDAATRLAPSWARPQDSITSSQPAQSKPVTTANTPNHTDKVVTPFVPLQVQTSRRRSQNQIGSTVRKELEGLPAPISVLPEPQPTSHVIQQQPQAPEAKPQRRRRLRIAAKLPGLED